MQINLSKQLGEPKILQDIRNHQHCLMLTYL